MTDLADRVIRLHDKHAKALGWWKHKVKVQNTVDRMRTLLDNEKQLDEQWIIRSKAKQCL